MEKQQPDGHPCFRHETALTDLMGHIRHQGLAQHLARKEWWCTGHVARSEGPLCPGAFAGRASIHFGVSYFWEKH